MPMNEDERLVAIVMILVGLIFFSSLVSQLTLNMHALGNNVGNLQFIQRASELRRYLRRKGIPSDLQQRVIRYVEYAYEEEQRLLPASRVVYLQYVSKGLRRELAESLVTTSMRSQECLEQVACCDALLTRSLCCLACQSYQYSPEEVVFAAGEKAEHLYVLKAGSFAYASGIETLSFPYVHERKGPPAVDRMNKKGNRQTDTERDTTVASVVRGRVSKIVTIQSSRSASPGLPILNAVKRASGAVKRASGMTGSSSGRPGLPIPGLPSARGSGTVSSVRSRAGGTVSSAATSRGTRQSISGKVKGLIPKAARLSKYEEEETHNREVIMAEMALISSDPWRHQRVLRSVRIAECVLVNRKAVDGCLEVYPDIRNFYKLLCELRESNILATFTVPPSSFLEERPIPDDDDEKPLLGDYIDERLVSRTRRTDPVDEDLLDRLETAVVHMNRKHRLMKNNTTEADNAAD